MASLSVTVYSKPILAIYDVISAADGAAAGRQCVACGWGG
jgi:hypothetical protein